MVNYKQIKEEILNRLRSADILTITQRGVTTTSDSFSGNDILTQFTLTNSGIKNIRSVVVDSVTLDPLVDYTYTLTEADATNKIINFTTAPGTGTNNVVITYDYSSSGDNIYDDFPIPSIKIGKYPRVAFDIVSEITGDKALQGALFQSNLLLEFRAYGKGRNQTEDIITSVRTYLKTNKLNFVRLNYIQPKGRSKIDIVTNTDNKVFTRTATFGCPYEFET